MKSSSVSRWSEFPLSFNIFTNLRAANSVFGVTLLVTDSWYSILSRHSFNMRIRSTIGLSLSMMKSLTPGQLPGVWQKYFSFLRGIFRVLIESSTFIVRGTRLNPRVSCSSSNFQIILDLRRRFLHAILYTLLVVVSLRLDDVKIDIFNFSLFLGLTVAGVVIVEGDSAVFFVTVAAKC